MRARMTMRGRAAAWENVEGDHHHLAAWNIAKNLLHELAHPGGRRLLLRRDGAKVEGGRERDETEKCEGSADDPARGHKHVVLPLCRMGRAQRSPSYKSTCR